jgi:hypothetical protein
MIEFSRNDAMSKLRSIPAVEKILQSLGETGLPRPLVVVTVRRELAEIRKEKDIPKLDAVLKGWTMRWLDCGGRGYSRSSMGPE